MPLINHTQDEKIEKLQEQTARLDERVISLTDKFDKFLTNEFSHLKDQMSWLFGLVVAGILIPILFQFFK